jgi:fibronectin type 3 domain-containing protein
MNGVGGADNYLAWRLTGSAPSTPGGVSAVGGTNEITVSWLSAVGAATYNLYRGLVPGGEGITPAFTLISGTSFMDSTVIPGLTYYYKVSAVNTFGESALSSEVNALSGVQIITGLGGSIFQGGSIHHN